MPPTVDLPALGRPGSIGRGRVLALLIAIGVLLAVLAALDPSTLRPGPWSSAFYGTVATGAVLGPLLWWGGHRVRDGGMAVILVVLAAIIMLSVLANQSRGGALLNVVLLLPPLLFAALHLPPRWTRGQELLTLVCCALAAGFAATDPVQWLSLTLVPAMAMIGAAEVVLLQRRHLTEALTALEVAAVTDPLTGLLNRRGLGDRSRAGAPTVGYRALLVIDIDLFKTINDTRGHAEGDEVLRVLGAGLRDAVRSEDLVTRMGGEEFAILSQVAAADVTAFAERLRVAAQIWMAPWSATISIGVVHTATDAEVLPAATELDVLLDRADRCLYEAKRGGRNRVVTAVLD